MRPAGWPLALLALPAGAAAQTLQPELRADAIVTDAVVWHVGAGLTWPLGNYTRVSGIGSYGIDDDPSTDGEWRGDLLARVTLDPFRRRSIGFSVGGGLTVRSRPYLLAVAEIEGPIRRGLSVAVQAGVGGGYRAGLVVRRAVPGRR